MPRVSMAHDINSAVQQQKEWIVPDWSMSRSRKKIFSYPGFQGIWLKEEIVFH
jgi:hypothetical protein